MSNITRIKNTKYISDHNCDADLTDKINEKILH